METARWWERHIAEVVYGLPPDAPTGTRPKPQYDPELHSLTAREQAKAANWRGRGIRYGEHGQASAAAVGSSGVVGGRSPRGQAAPPFGRADQRVVAAMRAAIDEADGASSRTASFVLWRPRAGPRGGRGRGRDAVAADVVPAVRQGEAGPAHDRVGADAPVAGQPARMGRSARCRAAPGELMQIDSTPLDVLVVLHDGIPGRVELTGMVDVATRSMTAAVLRPTTKSVDASLLLARTVTPEPMRPGWAEALGMSRSVLPHQRLLAIDQRLEHAAARPVIVPETIVCDHGKVFISRNFRTSCRHLGINFQPAHQGTPTDKPHIERMPRGGGHVVRQFVAGYSGSNAERRGRRPRQGRCGRCWSCRNCWMSGSSRPGRTGRMTGCATPPHRAGCSPRTKVRRPGRGGRLRAGRAGGRRTTSSCCPPAGRRSTLTG